MKPKARPPRVVAIGGGTGLSTLLSGLKRHTPDLTAVVTVTDEGGSSGRLRRAWGVLPPGDFRNCLAALARDGHLLSRLFQYRFPGGGARGGLEGHAFGNLFLTALSAVAGGFDRALLAASQVLAIRGRVLPVTLKPVRLNARLRDGRNVLGEDRIARIGAPIERVRLIPEAPSPTPGVLEALRGADLIVLGPGSLYTSVIPPLLAKGVSETLARSKAKKIYVCNVMTQPGETDGYDALDHLEALLEHCGTRPGGALPVDAMLVNAAPFPPAVLRHYERSKSFPVRPPDTDRWAGVRIARAALRPAAFPRSLPAAQARHSPVLLARAVMRLAQRQSLEEVA